MYQLGTKWNLWELDANFKDEVALISLRGYKEESPISLPSDFLYLEKKLSVEKISSEYCPIRRDVYLEIVNKIRIKSQHKTWGQNAGPIIEDYCKGLLDYFSKLAVKPNGLSYKKITTLVEGYTSDFKLKNDKTFLNLAKKASSKEEQPDRLIFLLQQTAKYELSLLGVDYEFRHETDKKFLPLTESIPIKFDDASVSINPDKHLGLSDVTTPDFIILDSKTIIGDVKTGAALRPFQLTTIAGYALAYESQHKTDVDYGIVYFFETHSKHLNFAQSYVFVIDDFLRKQFISARNNLYSILLRDTPPTIDEKIYDSHCKYCKYHDKCYP